MKIGITGSDGFIGYHTYNNLKFTTKYNVIKLKKDFHKDKRIKKCDWIIHLAGVNRSNGQNNVYADNIDLTNKLVESVGKNTNIIFASSTQAADSETMYGKAKVECEQVIQLWSQQYGGKFYNLRIPNVFGPFCKPNYNSFVATFCHNVCSGKDLKVTEDKYINLIYVNDVVEEFKKCIEGDEPSFRTSEILVSEVAERLSYFRDSYFNGGMIPKIDTTFDLNLFNTFLSYVPHKKRLIGTELFSDERGSLTELAKVDGSEGQVFFSTTNPGKVRGEHFHMRKFERFCVVDGEATIRIRKLGSKKPYEYKVSGDDIKVIDMPLLYTHNIENTGKKKLTTVFWINEIFNKQDTDTYGEKV